MNHPAAPDGDMSLPSRAIPWPVWALLVGALVQLGVQVAPDSYQVFGPYFLVTGDMVRDGVVAVDVGIDPVKDPETGKVRFVGDIEFESVAARAEAITPVPGGVGPITDVWLIGNAVSAAAAALRVEPRFGFTT